MMNVTIYTDGACSGNPGPGGWAAILIANGVEKEISGSVESTTNNRMEMTAAIEAFKALKVPCNVTLYSDSSYLVNAFLQNWIVNWKSNGWKNASKVPVSNMDLWLVLDELASVHSVRWEKVKGHSDNQYNNRCDKMAVMEIKKNNGNGETGIDDAGK
ncbi:MAG: ribonuclease HI [Saccharofermentanales bacterium]